MKKDFRNHDNSGMSVLKDYPKGMTFYGNEPVKKVSKDKPKTKSPKKK